jgi:bis(5'-nucleosidyl)-tetraphosphatase
MRQDKSYGIIPLSLHEGLWQVLLIQHQAGHWAFPKGHADLGEPPQHAAERELKEETGLTVQRYLSSDPLSERYHFTLDGELVQKNVHYFLALVKGQVAIQAREIQASEWLTLPQAHQRITFKEGKHVCAQVDEFLKTLDQHGNPVLA